MTSAKPGRNCHAVGVLGAVEERLELGVIGEPALAQRLAGRHHVELLGPRRGALGPGEEVDRLPTTASGFGDSAATP